LHALDWLNFFLAALLAGFGPFVAVHLADRGWDAANFGFVLTVSGLAGLITQVPGGELVDLVRSRRALVGVGAAAVAVDLVLFGLRPDFASVVTAGVIHERGRKHSRRRSAWASLGTTRLLSGSAAINALPPSAASRRPRSWV
jgi:MFS family permease